MDDQEFSNIYSIPANYTDSGRLFGGMLETRNTIEAVLIVLALGYPMVKWIHIAVTYKVALMIVILLPLGIFALMGFNGDSLGQTLIHIVRFWRSRRRLSMQRICSQVLADETPPAKRRSHRARKNRRKETSEDEHKKE